MTKAWFALAVMSLAFAACFGVAVADKQEYLDLETFAKVGGTLTTMGGSIGAGAFLRGFLSTGGQQ
ncbi:MAG: hypothetical protein AB7I13_15865 [Vicinamibacterales bacterium]